MKPSKKLITAVRKEIENLKVHATDREISRLNFEGFHPNLAHRCIYGQMALSCDNRRAQELMGLCCIRQVFIKVDDRGLSEYKAILTKYTGEDFDYSEQDGEVDTYRHYLYKSALEHYITLGGVDNENIIMYLKGETSTLNV